MAAAPLLHSRDTVSQPVASTQRPGRIYHADDFGPGLQRRRDPPLVASAVAAGRRAEGGAATYAANSDHHTNGTAFHSTAGPDSKADDDSPGVEQSLPKPASLADGTAPAEDAQASRRPRKQQRPPAKPKPKPAAQPTPAATDGMDPEPAAEAASAQQPAAEPLTAGGNTEPALKAAPRVLEGVQRDFEALAQCMACDICREVLLDPVKSPVCMHCYCRDCIDAFLVLGGTSNCCPVCQSAAVATSLGRDPYKDNLKFDFIMASLIRKVRHCRIGVSSATRAPRLSAAMHVAWCGLSWRLRAYLQQVSACIACRACSLPRCKQKGAFVWQVFPALAEDTARMAARAVKRAALNAALATQRATAAVPADRFPKRLRTDGQDVVELFVSGPGASLSTVAFFREILPELDFLVEAGRAVNHTSTALCSVQPRYCYWDRKPSSCCAEELALEQPYLRVHRTMPVGTLARFLADRLRDAGHELDEVLLTCDGGHVQPEEQLGAVLEQRWRAVPASGQLLIIEYSVKPGSSAN